MSRKIYLDFNASMPICPEAVEAMQLFLTDHYGNPSSLHWAGMPAKDAVEKARGQVAGLLGCDRQDMPVIGTIRRHDATIRNFESGRSEKPGRIAWFYGSFDLR
jgi:selenocysteine lyase/cysteine desulfurase